MKSLTLLNHESLLTQTRRLVAEEKRIELELLDHLREIDRRMLHLEMGYSSLYEFAVKHLCLSEASAYRRIEAMRVMREIPEVEADLKSGVLTLTNVASAQTFFKAEKKQGRSRSVAQKREVLEQIKGLSKRECERKLAEISPQAVPLQSMTNERQRVITAELSELRIVVDAETLVLLQKLKDALPGAATSEVIKRALRTAVREHERVRTPRPRATVTSTHATATSVQALTAPSNSPPAGKIKIPESGNMRSYAETRRLIFARAQYRCEFVAKNGARCQSTYALELDHIKPRAVGGTDTLQNLRVLCRAHNQLAAVAVLGSKCMSEYLQRLRI